MYRLKENLNKPLKEGFCSEDQEKKRRSVYLPVSVWKALDDIADRNDISRNKVLTKILKGDIGDLDLGDSSDR
jgi:macrodomain Ter protein organizer (MatP/YcbG family)